MDKDKQQGLDAVRGILIGLWLALLCWLFIFGALYLAVEVF